MSIDESFAGSGAPMSPRTVGDHVVSTLVDPAFEDIEVLAMKGDTGLTPLEGW